MRAIVITAQGGPEVLDHRELQDPVPGRGEVLVDVAASGVNFVDIYHRSGVYPVPLPTSIGSEGAGTVTALGPGVEGVAVGDRVAWVNVLGSYAERALVPADRLVPIPEDVSFEVAAASLLQGLTAHYLTHTTHEVKQGDTVLIHAAAGGMGLLLTQLAKLRGARVIGTVSTPEKEKAAREAGADEVIGYEGFAEQVKRLAPPGVDAVYDGIGKATFEGSLASARPRGVVAVYGVASGPVPSFDSQALTSRGSLFLARPSLVHHIAERDELLSRAADVFGWIGRGELKVTVSRRYPLAEARQAHEDLAARRTTGKLLLIP
ncbi:quinone oxidoreductase family protein [Nonomuraea mangrovi]|uniref:Quinone oxidoreductase family protein n=1 Tax=Nonomuraea mangrovi TaxID=2316207 RepID=A0ABW4SNB7_9ACTN